MTTAGITSGEVADNFAPYQTDPAPPAAPGDVAKGQLDPIQQLMIRGPVLTDEGGFREMLTGADPLGVAPWTPTLTSGTRVTAGGVVTFNSGVIAGGVNYVCREADYLPLQINLELQAAAAPGGTAEFFWGFYSNPDPAVAIASGQFSECSWLASDAAATGRQRGGAGGNIQGPVTFAITSKVTAGFRTLLLDADGSNYRDATTTLPTTTVRSTQSSRQPGLDTPLYLCFGFRNGAAPINWSVTVTTILLNNYNRLRVNNAV
jgi:hypothetical protein